MADRVWGALRAHPAATPAELATAARLPRATVTKLLTTWLAEGSVSAPTGETARAARRWTAVHTALPGHTPVPDNRVHTPQDDATISDLATADLAAPDPGIGTAAAPVSGGPAAPRAGAAGALSGDGSDPKRSARRSTSTRNSSGSRRLPSGALRGMVEDHLRDHPDAEWGPVAIGKALHRSSGAVANALTMLVTQDIVRQTSDRPKRYRLAEQLESTPDTSKNADNSADATVPDAIAPPLEVNP